MIALTVILCLALNATATTKKRSSSNRGKRTVISKSRRVEKGRVRRGKPVRKSDRGKRRRHHRYDEVTGASPMQRSAGIPTERVTEIQGALIKSGYLEGPPTGQYDANTIEAMKEFQAANSLPASGAPSAHALKKLGVSKTSNDGYSVPVKSVSVSEKKANP